MELDYRDYLTVADFLNKQPLLESSYVINKNTIRRNAITNGKPPWRGTIPHEILKWKLSLVDTFIDFSQTSSKIKMKNIQALEESEVRIVSFTLGMLFAQCYTQKFMGVNQLYHLKNLIKERAITVSTKGKFPDFVGISRDFDEIYLIEAKGSSTKKRYMSKKTIIEASEQLQSVLSISTHQKVRGQSYDKLYFGGNLKKFIIATHPNLQNNLAQEVIDPEEVKKIQLVLDEDKAIYLYYEHLMFILNNSKSREETIFNNVYMVFDVPEFNVSYGLLIDIYEILNEVYKRDFRKVTSEGLKEKIENILQEFEGQTESEKISIGKDGIMSMDKNFEWVAIEIKE